ncbi:hypothetical protein VTL71DRAFT_1377 [Oculimacula yallundae]
MSSTAR